MRTKEHDSTLIGSTLYSADSIRMYRRGRGMLVREMLVGD